MDAHSTYAYATASWLSLQALPLLFFPKLIVTLLSPDARIPTDLETYLSRTLALTLLSLSTLHVLLSGALPLSSALAETETHTPYAAPAAFVSTAFHLASLVYMYGSYAAAAAAAGGGGGNLGLVCGMVGAGTLSAWGVWVLVFGGGDGGGGERVSGWPFRNERERAVKREKMARRRL